jgi:hypothetical protein
MLPNHKFDCIIGKRNRNSVVLRSGISDHKILMHWDSVSKLVEALTCKRALGALKSRFS